MSTILCNVHETSHPLKSSKSPGSDQLSLLLLRECPVKLEPPLSLFNNSFGTVQVPLSCLCQFFFKQNPYSMEPPLNGYSTFGWSPQNSLGVTA